MARGKKVERLKAKNGASLGFEQTLWQAADKLRGHMDAAEYKHVVLGLIFLKYISDAFQELTHRMIDFLMPQKTHSRWHAVRNSLPDGVSFELYRGLVA